MMYLALINIGDDKCWAAVNKALLNDPVTETREQIFVRLKKHPDTLGRVIDTVVKMAEGAGAKHNAVTPSRMRDGYEWCLADYLKWAGSLPNLDAATHEKIEKAKEILSAKGNLH